MPILIPTPGVKLRFCILTISQMMTMMLLVQLHTLKSKSFFKDAKNQSLSPNPSFCPLPVSSTCYMCGQNSRDSHNPAPALGQDPQWPGQTHTSSGSRAGYWVKTAKGHNDVFLRPRPLPPSPAPNPGLILELLNNNKASHRVRQDNFKAGLFLFHNYLISECSSQICKTHVCGNKPLLLKDD